MMRRYGSSMTGFIWLVRRSYIVHRGAIEIPLSIGSKWFLIDFYLRGSDGPSVCSIVLVAYDGRGTGEEEGHFFVLCRVLLKRDEQKTGFKSSRVAV